MKRSHYPACAAAALVITAAATSAATANMIRSPGLESSLAWYTAGNAQISPWSESDGNCVHGTSGVIWQHIAAWQLPYSYSPIYSWNTSKRPFGSGGAGGTRYTQFYYGLKTPASLLDLQHSHKPNGIEGVDYTIVGGASTMSTGNGFWWNSSYYKGEIGSKYVPLTRSNYPFGLIMECHWSGEIGLDDFFLGPLSATGIMPAAAIPGTPTGTPNQHKASIQLDYSGFGVNTPIWIDPEIAYGYEYEISTDSGFGYALNDFKAIELPRIGDNLFDVEVWRNNQWESVAADYNADNGALPLGAGVKKFRVLGINDPGVAIDPAGHDFPLGVMFTSGGWKMELLMTGLAVPEPTSLMVLSLGAVAALRRRRA